MQDIVRNYGDDPLIIFNKLFGGSNIHKYKLICMNDEAEIIEPIYIGTLTNYPSIGLIDIKTGKIACVFLREYNYTIKLVQYQYYMDNIEYLWRVSIDDIRIAFRGWFAIK